MTRVRDKVAALRNAVGNAADLRTALQSKPRTSPAAYLQAEERGGPVKYSGPVTVQDVSVSLQLVLFFRSAKGEGDGAGAREGMDVLIAATRAALVGWSPGDAFQALYFQAGRDEYFDCGWLVSQQIYQTGYRIQHQVQP
ncbi:hypothetical protein [Pseudoxanthomonas mexicana]|uniref:phage tail terminator protein n=1 Tax=Pseudoxanthomonas mexicana TaxID=128785 RepID=UPI00398B536D